MPEPESPPQREAPPEVLPQAPLDDSSLAPPEDRSPEAELSLTPDPLATPESTPTPIVVRGAPSGAPWDFLDLVFALMTVLGSLFLAEFAAMIALMALSVMRGAAPSGSDLITRMTGDVRIILAVQLASNIAILAFVYLTARVKHNRSFAEAIQWRPVGSRTWLFLAAGVGLAFASQIIPILFPSNRQFPIEKMFRDPVSAYLMALFGIGIAPFIEEMFFRGIIYPVFERRWGLEIGVLVSSLLFAGIHGPQLAGQLPQLGAIFLVGVALGYVRGRTGSLVPGFLMHTSYNGTLFTAIFVATHGFRKFPV